MLSAPQKCYSVNTVIRQPIPYVFLSSCSSSRSPIKGNPRKGKNKYTKLFQYFSGLKPKISRFYKETYSGLFLFDLFGFGLILWDKTYCTVQADLKFAAFLLPQPQKCCQKPNLLGFLFYSTGQALTNHSSWINPLTPRDEKEERRKKGDGKRDSAVAQFQSPQTWGWLVGWLDGWLVGWLERTNERTSKFVTNLPATYNSTVTVKLNSYHSRQEAGNSSTNSPVQLTQASKRKAS